MAKVNSVAFDPADRWLASAGADGTIRLWELNDPTAFLPAGEPVTAMDLGPGGQPLRRLSARTVTCRSAT